jgi:hypothetical protein
MVPLRWSRSDGLLLVVRSARLRGDASIVVATRAFQRVSYLSHPDIESEFLCLLTVRFRLAVFSRLERIATTNLFIVDRGVCAKKGKVALVGSCFGEDMIVTNPFLRDTGDTIALTFVQVWRTPTLGELRSRHRAPRVIEFPASHCLRRPST